MEHFFGKKRIPMLIIDKKDLNKLISVTTMLKYKPKIIGCIAKKNSNKAIVYEKN